MVGDVYYDHDAERDEHEEASGVEDAPESYDNREDQPGDHESQEENRLGPNYRGSHLGEQ